MPKHEQSLERQMHGNAIDVLDHLAALLRVHRQSQDPIGTDVHLTEHGTGRIQDDAMGDAMGNVVLSLSVVFALIVLRAILFFNEIGVRELNEGSHKPL